MPFAPGSKIVQPSAEALRRKKLLELCLTDETITVGTALEWWRALTPETREAHRKLSTRCHFTMHLFTTSTLAIRQHLDECRQLVERHRDRERTIARARATEEGIARANGDLPSLETTEVGREELGL
jgi:enoyl-CoA hydratase/carnithine racemase